MNFTTGFGLYKGLDLRQDLISGTCLGILAFFGVGSFTVFELGNVYVISSNLRFLLSKYLELFEVPEFQVFFEAAIIFFWFFQGTSSSFSVGLLFSS